MACENCENFTNETKKISVPYMVHEGAMARAERHIKRLWIAIIVAVSLIFASNALWLWAWMQYDYTSTYEEIIVDSADGGNANYIGQDGNIYNGENNSQESDTNAN